MLPWPGRRRSPCPRRVSSCSLRPRWPRRTGRRIRRARARASHSSPRRLRPRGGRRGGNRSAGATKSGLPVRAIRGRARYRGRRSPDGQRPFRAPSWPRTAPGSAAKRRGCGRARSAVSRPRGGGRAVRRQRRRGTARRPARTLPRPPVSASGRVGPASRHSGSSASIWASPSLRKSVIGVSASIVSASANRNSAFCVGSAACSSSRCQARTRAVAPTGWRKSSTGGLIVAWYTFPSRDVLFPKS